MRLLRTILLAVVVASCTSAQPAIDHVSLADLDLAVPAGWVRTETSALETWRGEWSPIENPSKESVAVIRSRPLETLARSGSQVVERLLVEAQHTLAGAEFGAPTRFTTPSGLTGVRLDGSFVPPGKQQRYRRTHAVVVDRTDLIHVIYTAVSPNREPLEVVLEHLRSRKES